MSDREKIVELLEQLDAVSYEKSKTETGFAIIKRGKEYIADYLLSHGVTVKEPQKPLTLAEARERNNKRLPLYMECNYTERWHGMPPLNGWVVGLGWLRSWLDPDDNPSGFLEENYGSYWRCWAENPTEEERKAAEWL